MQVDIFYPFSVYSSDWGGNFSPYGLKNEKEYSCFFTKTIYYGKMNIDTHLLSLLDVGNDRLEKTLPYTGTLIRKRSL